MMKRKYLTIALLPLVLASCNGRGGNTLGTLPRGAKEATKEEATAAANEIATELNSADAFGFSIQNGSFSHSLTNSMSYTGVSINQAMNFAITDLNFNFGIRNFKESMQNAEASITLSFKINATANGMNDSITATNLDLNGEASVAAYLKNNNLYVDYSSAATKELVNSILTAIGSDAVLNLPDKFKISELFTEDTTIDDAAGEIPTNVIHPTINVSYADILGNYAKFYTYENGGVGAEYNMDTNSLSAAIQAANAAAIEEGADDPTMDVSNLASAEYSVNVNNFSNLAYLDSTSGFIASEMDFSVSSTGSVDVQGITMATTTALTVKDSIRLDFVTGNNVIVDSPVEADYVEYNPQA